MLQDIKHTDQIKPLAERNMIRQPPMTMTPRPVLSAAPVHGFVRDSPRNPVKKDTPTGNTHRRPNAPFRRQHPGAPPNRGTLRIGIGIVQQGSIDSVPTHRVLEATAKECTGFKRSAAARDGSGRLDAAPASAIIWCSGLSGSFMCFHPTPGFWLRRLATLASSRMFGILYF